LEKISKPPALTTLEDDLLSVTQPKL